MDNDDLFKLAVATREFEIQMFWQRSNYFMALNTAIAVGFFTNNNLVYSSILAALGMIVCMLWYFVNLGGKYWQCRWEEAASRFEQECAPDAKLFSASKDEVHNEVIHCLEKGSRKSWFQRWLNKNILDKPSVSYQMILLSFIFGVFWAFVLCALIISQPVKSVQSHHQDVAHGNPPANGHGKK